MIRVNNILHVIREASGHRRADVTAQLFAAMTLPTATEIVNAPIFARHGIKVLVSASTGNTIALRCPNGRLIFYNLPIKTIQLKQPKVHEQRQVVTLDQLRKIDLADLMLNPYHQIKQQQKINPTFDPSRIDDDDKLPLTPDQLLDRNDLLAKQYVDRQDYKMGIRDDRGRQRDEEWLERVRQRAEQRSGLSFNPNGRQRVVRKTSNEK